jgi:NTE family protein
MSPGYDTMIQSAMDRRNLPALFAALPLLKELDPQWIGELANEIAWFSVPGGTQLYSAGEVADNLYVIVNGAFGSYIAQPSGGSRCVGTLSAGRVAGDTDVIAGTTRSTTLVALRDSEVARLSRATFEKLVKKHPQTMRTVAKGLAEQVRTLQQAERRPVTSPKTFAIVPLDASVDARALGSDLVTCLRSFGRAELISSTDATERTTHWFHRVERANEFVAYLTDSEPSNWSRLCIRRADLLLLVARAASEPQPWRALECIEGAADAHAAEIILMHRASSRSGAARDWLLAQHCRRLHHARNINDIARAARLLTGRSVGLVLSGGGARGFAHIGVLRALKEAGIAIDSIGATSIGAIIGAGWAAGWDYPDMLERMRRAFVLSNPLNDYTLPVLSLVAGRKVSRLMRQEFGEDEIEDLRLPYYCTSANLTTGHLAVHRSGKLWQWLRASIAIPGILPPVFTQKQAFVDGATLNNLPVDVMREDFQGPIIAVDASTDRGFVSDLEMTEVSALWGIRHVFRRRPHVNIMQILLRAGMLNSAAASITQRELADVLLKPPLERVDLLDWRAFEQAIDIGYRHASQALESVGDKLTVSRAPPAAH